MARRALRGFMASLQIKRHTIGRMGAASSPRAPDYTVFCNRLQTIVDAGSAPCQPYPRRGTRPTYVGRVPRKRTRRNSIQAEGVQRIARADEHVLLAIHHVSLRRVGG